MSEIAISVEGVGKKYKIGHQKSGDFRESFRNILHGQYKNKTDFFWALKDISFEVKQGDAVGIIGRNGAGKSTLLKILSRITKPTKGRFSIAGRVSSLLEVGTGFHAELTGRENIFLNGTILGMKRVEIREKLDDIVAFSGVEEFLDTPVKHYSSGMKVRLAFSVAAHLEPEILIIDEVLAVGDAEFQKKCLGKMEDVAGQGRTVLFVSHNMAAVNTLCNNGLLIYNGELIAKDTATQIINLYTRQNRKHLKEPLLSRKDRLGNLKLKFSEVKIFDSHGDRVSELTSGSNYKICLYFMAPNPIKHIIFRMQVLSDDNYILFTLNNFHSSAPFSEISKENCVSCSIENLPLNEGRYYINLQCLVGREIADEIEIASSFTVVKGDFFGTGKLPSVKQGVLLKHKWELGDD